MSGLSFEEINIGDTAETTRTISEKDVDLFAEITGDSNPAHLDEKYANDTVFEHRIAHGILISGLISNVIGNQLPGNGSIYVAQNIKFRAPVYLGESISAKVEVIEKQKEKKRIVLKTTCVNHEGKTVIDGEAIVSAPRK